MDSKPEGKNNSLKKAVRETRETIIQHLKSSEGTKDDFMDYCKQNFVSQYETACKFRKKLEKYIIHLKEMDEENQKFQASLLMMFDNSWQSRISIAQTTEKINLTVMSHVNSLKQCVTFLDKYIDEFSEMKEKINQHEKKRISYDAIKRTFDTMKAARKRDNLKYRQVFDELSQAYTIYKENSQQLYEDLPDFYDRRIEVYTENLTELFTSNHTLHMEMSQHSREAIEIVKQLKEDYRKGLLKSRRQRFTENVPVYKNSISEGSSASPTNSNSDVRSFSFNTERKLSLQNAIYDDVTSSANPSSVANEEYDYCHFSAKDPSPTERKESIASSSQDFTTASAEDDPDSHIYSCIEKVEKKNKMKAKHKYQAKSEDELSIKIGDCFEPIEAPSNSLRDENRWIFVKNQSTLKTGWVPIHFLTDT